MKSNRTLVLPVAAFVVVLGAVVVLTWWVA